MKTCAAPGCGKPLEPRQGEIPAAFMRRKTCGGQCAKRLGAATQTTTVICNRDCPACGTALEQRANEYPAQFMARKTCNKECGDKLRIGTIITADRRCAACGETLSRRSGELPSTFMKRQTCGEECGRALRRAKVDFYGVLLSAGEVATILGVAKATVLQQQRPKKGASQKRAREDVCYCGAPVEAGKTRCRPCLNRNADASNRSRHVASKPWRAIRRAQWQSAMSGVETSSTQLVGAASQPHVREDST